MSTQSTLPPNGHTSTSPIPLAVPLPTPPILKRCPTGPRLVQGLHETDEAFRRRKRNIALHVFPLMTFEELRVFVHCELGSRTERNAFEMLAIACSPDKAELIRVACAFLDTDPPLISPAKGDDKR